MRETRVQERVLATIESLGQATQRDVSERIGARISSVATAISRLAAAGKIYQHGTVEAQTMRNGYPVKYLAASYSPGQKPRNPFSVLTTQPQAEGKQDRYEAVNPAVDNPVGMLLEALDFIDCCQAEIRKALALVEKMQIDNTKLAAIRKVVTG